MKVTTDGCLFGAWVAAEIEKLQNKPASILDIGTGTGLLSLMLAQKTNASIDAIEIDKDAAEQAVANSEASPFATNIHIINGDATLFHFTQQYDMIISNPPFYEKELKGNDLKKNLAHHNEGLLLPRLLDLIKKNLNPSGSFFLLLPYKRKEEIKKLLIEKEFHTEQIVFVRQTVQHDYFRIMFKGKLKQNGNNETSIQEISIKDGDQYTKEFRALLKDYYLQL